MKEYLTNILQLLQILLLLFIVYQLNHITGRVKNPNTRKAAANRAIPKKINIDMNSFVKGSAFKGNRDAKVTVVKYNSFSCGFCKKAKKTLEQVMKTYPDDVKIVYKHFVRNQQDLLSAQAVECAGDQGKFWDVYNNFFEKGFRGDINKLSKDLNLNLKKLQACIDSGKYKRKILNDTEVGRSFGINGTPAFIINGKMFIGYKPFGPFNEIIKAEMR